MAEVRRTSCPPRSNDTPDAEATALAAAYRYILDCHVKRKAAGEDGGEDAKKEKK